MSKQQERLMTKNQRAAILSICATIIWAVDNNGKKAAPESSMEDCVVWADTLCQLAEREARRQE